MQRRTEFAEYAQARQGHLLRTAYLLCGDPHQAQDLAQEALTNLCRFWSRASRADSVDAYARRVLVNAYLANERKLKRERDTHIALALDAPPPRTDDSELRLELVAGLAQLGKRGRAVLVLRFWEDLSVEATAAVLSCSVGTVKSQTSRSLVRLREVLGADWAGRMPAEQAPATRPL
jgi:RNA polymerase sigma-70 factor (sigma-E family)